MSNYAGVSGGMHERVMSLVKESIRETSSVALSNATGIARPTLGRCANGIGEPSQATLEKLAGYFGVSVLYLRGGDDSTNVHTEKDTLMEILSLFCGPLTTRAKLDGARAILDREDAASKMMPAETDMMVS